MLGNYEEWRGIGVGMKAIVFMKGLMGWFTTKSPKQKSQILINPKSNIPYTQTNCKRRFEPNRNGLGSPFDRLQKVTEFGF